MVEVSGDGEEEDAVAETKTPVVKLLVSSNPLLTDGLSGEGMSLDTYLIMLCAALWPYSVDNLQ